MWKTHTHIYTHMCTHTCVCIELSFSIMVLRWSFELEMYLGSGEGSSLDSATGVEFYCSCSSKYYTFENNTLILHCKNHYVFGPHSQVNKADCTCFHSTWLPDLLSPLHSRCTGYAANAFNASSTEQVPGGREATAVGAFTVPKAQFSDFSACSGGWMVSSAGSDAAVIVTWNHQAEPTDVSHPEKTRTK